MARIVIEKDLSEGTFTESDPYVAPLGGDFRNFNVRSLAGEVRFRDENSSAWATLREGESWDCFDPPIDELRFAGSGSFEIVADTSVQINPSGGGAASATERVLAHLVPYQSWQDGSLNQTVVDLEQPYQAPSSGVLGGSTPAGTFAQTGIRNGLDAYHIGATGGSAGQLQAYQFFRLFAPRQRYFLNPHSFDLANVEDFELLLEDEMVISSEAAAPTDDTRAEWGWGSPHENEIVGIRAHRDAGEGWHSIIRDGTTAFEDTDLGLDPTVVHRLGIGLRIKGGARSVRWYGDGSLIRELELPLASDFNEALPVHDTVEWRARANGSEEFTISAMVGRGLRIKEILL